MTFSINGHDYKQSVPVNIAPAESNCILNLRVPTPNGLPVKPGLQKLRAMFAYNGIEIGEAELPISVEFANAIDMPQVKS